MVTVTSGVPNITGIRAVTDDEIAFTERRMGVPAGLMSVPAAEVCAVPRRKRAPDGAPL